ncbi:MAG: YdjY domain-containing protein [Planctomycetota bacterium]
MPCSCALIRLTLVCALAAQAAALDTSANANDPLLALPDLPKPALFSAALPPSNPTTGTALSTSVRFVQGQRVVLDGNMQVDKGPADGLEVLACLGDGKTHETLIRLTGTDGAVVKGALLAAFGLPDGRPAAENSGIPGRGVPMRIQVMWKDENASWHWADAGNLVRDRRTDRTFPTLPWVYTGSRMMLISENGPDKKIIRRERFMLDATKSVAVNYDEADALFASPFPCAVEDNRYEANSLLCPPPQTPVHLVISPAEVVLELKLDASGGLSRAGALCDDAALAAAITAAFGGKTEPAHRAITVRVAPAITDEIVIATRTRLLAAAKAAKTWAVPVFQPE